MFAVHVMKAGYGGRNLDSRAVHLDTKTTATVRVTIEANEQARQLPKPIRHLFAKCIERLRKWPTVRGAKPFSGNLAGWYRLRLSDYRLRFRVEGDIVTVDKIGHRKDVYEN